TGASFYTAPLVSKRLDLARELVPGGSTIAVLINPDNPGSVPEGMAAETSAAAVGQPLLVLGASTRDQIDDAFAAIKQQRVGALLVASDPFFFSEGVKLVVQMARHAVPTIFADREQAEAGGLISYGASRAEAYRQAGNYVGRIVRGEKPADLPVMLPAKFHLVINLKTTSGATNRVSERKATPPAGRRWPRATTQNPLRSREPPDPQTFCEWGGFGCGWRPCGPRHKRAAPSTDRRAPFARP